ncbi:MAG: hypothetical protein AAGJ37_11215 [Pseudomonadota bacterium]
MTITSAMSYTTIFILSIISLSATTGLSASVNKSKQMKRDPIVTTSKKDDIYFVHAEMDVNFTPSEFLTLVNASDEDCSWIANCRKVNILSKQNNVQIIHTKLSVNWPFKDRDMVVLTVYSLNEESLSITLSDQSTYTDFNKDYVRITDVTGEWKMIKNGPEYYSLSYRGAASPNGVIPDWFAVNYLADSTKKTFLALNKRLEKTSE